MFKGFFLCMEGSDNDLKSARIQDFLKLVMLRSLLIIFVQPCDSF